MSTPYSGASASQSPATVIVIGLDLSLTSTGVAVTHNGHTCDNPPCCNPAHLIAGTHAQNMADMAARERSPHRRLTATQVLDIRERRRAGAQVIDLAAAYGVTPSNVSQIVRHRTWKHIGEAA